MSKTIEELAKAYAEDMCPVGDYCGGVYDEQRNSDLPIYTDDAKSVLEWLSNKPLASRMTKEEKERVRIYHRLARDGYWECNCADKAVVKILESIFGADFFKEI